MRLLAIDTALSACAAAVFDSDTDEVLASESLPMERGHAEALMPLIARVMDQAQAEFRDLGRIAVTVGPGSFTGLRVGISAARGIALAAGRPAVGVSTLSAYAAPCIAEDLSNKTIAVIDARHAHVYMQVFGEGGYTLFPPGYAPIEQALDYLGGEVHLTGSATEQLLALWPASEPPPFLFRAAPAPDLAWIARLGAAADPETAPASPLYLRAPDAKAQDGALARR
jgi:tRNA threonylcarbamoyladenosine biosynthesis protein TsaB